MAQVRRFGIFQTAKVMGILYALVGLIVLPFYLLIASFAPRGSGAGIGLGLAIFIPVIYGICGFIFIAIGCAIYNWVAGMVGGIEVELNSNA